MQTKSLNEKRAFVKEISDIYQNDYQETAAAIGLKKALEIIEELQDDLEERRAYIVANPCAQCGGKINAMNVGLGKKGRISSKPSS